MKLALIVTLFLSTFIFAGTSYAQGEVNKILKGKEESKEVQKKKRRKKALMCNECGKPEVECDCEGHNNKHKHN